MFNWLPTKTKVVEYGLDLATTYLRDCLRGKNIDTKSVLLKPFSHDGMLNNVLLWNPGNPYLTRWIAVNRNNVTLYRYDNEIDNLNIKFLVYGRRPATLTSTSSFLPKPLFTLGAILEAKEVLQDPRTPGACSPEEALTYFSFFRQATDFAFYCAFGPDESTREAFVKLIKIKGKQPITEKVFKACFGKNYNEFFNEMYGYFRESSRGTGYKGDPWGAPEMVISRFTENEMQGEIQMADATRSQSARIISDWFILTKQPAIARQVLQLADENAPWGRKDPEFLAALGLDQSQGGASNKALALLEQAASANITRPEVYRTLASLRLESIMETKGSAYRLSQPEVDAILGPLLVASKQPQPSPKTYFQIIDLWQHTDCEPPANLPDSMAADCGRYFPDNFTLLDQLIPFLVQHNCSAAAAKLLDETAKCVLTAEEQAHLAKLGSSLPNPAKPEPKG